MANDDFCKDIGKLIASNISLILFAFPFILHLMQIKISFSPFDYQTYLWGLFILYGLVTYGYVCDHIWDLFSFTLLFTVQIHSALFFFIQKIFPLTSLEKVVMTTYLVFICLFMNIMIRQYRIKGKKSKISENKLLFFTNQCSGTVFAQLLFLELHVFDFQNYEKILNQYPWDLATYIIFNLLSIFGFFVGLCQMFEMVKYKESYYDLQKYWFYFTGLFAFLCFLILKWDTSTSYELFILICTYFYFFVIIFSQQSKAWFLVLSIFLGITQVVIQIMYHSDINDIWIHICASINNIFLTRSLAWLIVKAYTRFVGEMDPRQKEVIGVFFEM